MSERKIKFFEKEISNILNESNHISNSIATFRIYTPFKNNVKKDNNNQFKKKIPKTIKKFNLNLYKKISLSSNYFELNKEKIIKKIILKSNKNLVNTHYNLKTINKIKIENFSQPKTNAKYKNNFPRITKNIKTIANHIKINNISNISNKHNNIIKTQIKNKKIKNILLNEDNNIFKKIENKIKMKSLIEKRKEKKLIDLKKNKLILSLFENNSSLFIRDDIKNITSFPLKNQFRQNKLKYTIFNRYKIIKDMTNKIILYK